MMEPCGYFKVYRKIFKHFKKPYTEMEAWIWCIGEAEWREDGCGCFEHSLGYLAEAWGWLREEGQEKLQRNRVLRVLRRWRNRGWIELRGGTPNGTDRGTPNGTHLTRVILLNYERLQSVKVDNGTLSGTGIGTASDTERKEQENKEKKRTRTPLPPKGGSRSSRAIHDPEKLTEILDALDLAPFEKKYGTLIDVQSVWQRFRNRVIGAGNPRHYIRFEQAFDNWCLPESQKAEGQPVKPQKPWYIED